MKQLVEAGFRVCVTHGNGPQVGLLALQDPTARLEVLDAETEGQLGFILELELANALRGSGREVAALLTQASSSGRVGAMPCRRLAAVGRLTGRQVHAAQWPACTVMPLPPPLRPCRWLSTRRTLRSSTQLSRLGHGTAKRWV